MPAAAVIPAPIAYTNVVAVKKLVVGFLISRVQTDPPGQDLSRGVNIWRGSSSSLHWAGYSIVSFTLRKLECSKQALALNMLAWNNDIGLRFYLLVVRELE